MYLKIMNGLLDGLHDHDGGKAHRMVETTKYEFFINADDEYRLAYQHNGSEVVESVSGNIYVLNDQGKTINSFYPIIRNTARQSSAEVTTHPLGAREQVYCLQRAIGKSPVKAAVAAGYATTARHPVELEARDDIQARIRELKLKREEPPTAGGRQ